MIDRLNEIKRRYWKEVSRALWIILLVVWLLAPLLELFNFNIALGYSIFVILLYLQEIHENYRREERIHFYEKRADLLKTLNDEISGENIRTLRGIFLSGMWFRTYMDYLVHNETNVEILLQHPDYAHTPAVKSGFEAFIAYRDLYDNTKVKIYLYREHGAYEGIEINNRFIMSSWYLNLTNDSGKTVRGSGNAKIVARAPSEGFMVSQRMFNRTWEGLKNNSISLSDYLNEIDNK